MMKAIRLLTIADHEPPSTIMNDKYHNRSDIRLVIINTDYWVPWDGGGAIMNDGHTFRIIKSSN